MKIPLKIHYYFYKKKILLAIFLLFFLPSITFAYTLEQLELTPRGDFILEPGKSELTLSPGESVTRQISITSRIDDISHFRISTEDFTGSLDPSQAVVLLGDEKGPYSLRDYLTPEINEFSLSLGEKISISVQISIPKDAQPGGALGAVIIQSDPRDVSSSGQAKIISRLGTLFLVRVEGEVTESGTVADFRVTSPNKWFHEKGPIRFEILFNNTGSVHLVPHGIITIKNIFGTEMAQLPVDAYFALPDSLRFREVVWNKETLLGRYTATLSLNPGFGDISEVAEVSFWVLPWKIILGVFFALFIIIYLFYFIGSRFEFRHKKR